MGITSAVFLPRQRTLRQLVRQVWRVEGVWPHGCVERILPKGVAELIFDLSTDDVHFRKHGQVARMPRCVLNGLNLTPVDLLHQRGHSFLGIQLEAPAVRCLFGVPTHELTDRVVDAELLSRELTPLWHQLAERTTFEERVGLLMPWLDKALHSHGTGALRSPWSVLCETPAGSRLSVKESARRYGCSERHFRRQCVEWLGVGPERFVSYRRYLGALKLLHDATCRLTEVALSAGYYDQSHFIRDFRAFAGLSPGHYRRLRNDPLGHLLL